MTDRYLTAFERGTLDDDDGQIRERLTLLKDQTRHLRGRKADLQLQIDQPPQALSPTDLAALSNEIRQILTSDEPHTRKGLFDALIHEITILTDDTVRRSSASRSPETTKGQSSMDQPQTRTARFVY